MASESVSGGCALTQQVMITVYTSASPSVSAALLKESSHLERTSEKGASYESQKNGCQYIIMPQNDVYTEPPPKPADVLLRIYSSPTCPFAQVKMKGGGDSLVLDHCSHSYCLLSH